MTAKRAHLSLKPPVIEVLLREETDAAHAWMLSLSSRSGSFENGMSAHQITWGSEEAAAYTKARMARLAHEAKWET